MGLTKAYNSPGLSFELDTPALLYYSPGDLISGQVVLNTTDQAAIGSVTVSFWGRAKSHIIQQYGQSGTSERGRTQFFQQNKILYTGHCTHKPSFLSWPFEFVVPDQADPVCIRSGKAWKIQENYTSTQVRDLDLNLLPSMFQGLTAPPQQQ
ncbi:hypothetical protein A1O3_10398 [Capronia epimyces CBS 606.96]|uniref:Arrestin-like N-terminal domain-containing protein n=1 Tax=Capronia epimyces CBS 606.96 TaxID=1182542 RepID=W9XIQ4_9EURO|nr:uncharacterized protein A1O3_10398 [Capronia epimyces CBS 606.96]EXJ77240.1 hypothetical protein A1O3_10398 [Capronia epimyces CBS 606.96]